MPSTDLQTRIVIVGHIDHGKSTFIGRLLFDTKNLAADRLADIEKVAKERGQKIEFAHIMDQFQEERDNDMTIDTTQTFLKLDGRPFVIIDAPGHKEYLKNMITGATQAESGILMLDINEGVKEQTETHARVLKLLGIQKLAVMINKMDTVNHAESAFRALESKIRALLQKYGMEPQMVVPISAYHGENLVQRSEKMKWYTGPTAMEFIAGCRPFTEREPSGSLCFPIQLVHEVDGARLALGRVERGQVRAHMKGVLFPSGQSVEIAAVQKFKEKATTAVQGESVALQFKNDPKIERGHVVVANKKDATAVRSFSLHAFWASESAAKVGDEVTVECRTQSAVCKITELLDDVALQKLSSLSNGDIARVRLTPQKKLLLDTPESNEALSRVVLHVNGNVAGCGVVADVDR